MTTVIAFAYPYDESSCLTVRTYLSTSYLTSAALLARKAYAIEVVALRLPESAPSLVDEVEIVERIGVLQRTEHHAYASSAIVMSALGLEAFVNELFADCEAAGAGNLFGLSGDQAEKLALVWSPPQLSSEHGSSRKKYADFERESAFRKYDRVLTALSLPALDTSAKPVMAMQTLMELRNALAHYKLAAHTAGVQGERSALSNLEKELQQYLVDHDQPNHNPMTGEHNSYFPDRVIGHAVAEWSVQTAIAFLLHVQARLSVTPRQGDRWPTTDMEMTRFEE
ncbi:hypothetical protein [Achromobacter kerstersii]|uniref:Uncharacterized protein n=1 Tax=Achromobacter kerstersii TaxID=1353890 RepID=A0A6S7ABE0_9BURK|nr:hypothetical protein [Achromobacter kerstersii]CAB3710902.1 hypothetical protein LMG3441_03123 [Achromobacter kerstersii]